LPDCSNSPFDSKAKVRIVGSGGLQKNSSVCPVCSTLAVRPQPRRIAIGQKRPGLDFVSQHDARTYPTCQGRASPFGWREHFARSGSQVHSPMRDPAQSLLPSENRCDTAQEHA
jgi:hypothetical protein